MGNVINNWYVFYTRSKAEKKVQMQLLQMNYEVFLPLVKTLRRWRNRQKKIISRVLFPGYIFVRTRECEIYSIIHIPRIVRCVKTGDHPGIVPDSIISCIKLMLTMDQDVYAENDFSEGEHVRVVSGPLTGCEGILLQSKGRNRFGILIKDIQQCACIDISVSMLERI